MFEREIKFIYDFNLNKVNKLGPYFTFEQLSNSDINPAILHYISSEIDYLIFEDRQKLLKNSVFDYSGAKISQLFEQVGEEVKRKKRFSIEYISKLILHASSFTINFLVRPKWTLIKFVFDENEHKTTSEIKQILNYLYFYRHIKTILISYINTKKIISMNSEEFTALFEKVDNLGVETYLSSVLAGALKSMAEFFNIGEVQKNKIPLIAVKTFLEEKNLSKHCDKIKSTFGEDENTKFSIIEFQKVFDGIVPEKEEFITGQIENDLFEQVVEQHDIEIPEETESEIEPVSNNKKEEDNFKSIIEQSLETVPDYSNDFDEEVNAEQDIIKDLNEKLHEEQKPVKIKINFKDDIKIEKINEEKPVEPEEIPENNVIEEDQDLFMQIQEDVVQEIVEEPIFLQSEDDEEMDSDEFDNVDLVIDSMIEKQNSFSDDAEEEEEIKDTSEESENSLNNLVESLENNSDETENILESILQNKKDEEPEDEVFVPHTERNSSYNDSKKMDLAELLEHKDMTKIIESVFDYDIEEFSTTLEDIMESDDLETATEIINKSLKQHGINRKSKEAELFKQIISDFFEDKN